VENFAITIIKELPEADIVKYHLKVAFWQGFLLIRLFNHFLYFFFLFLKFSLVYSMFFCVLFRRYLIKFSNELTFKKSLLNEKHDQNSDMMHTLIETTYCLQSIKYWVSNSSIYYSAIIQSNYHFCEYIIIPFIWDCAYIIWYLTKLKVSFLPIFENLIN